MDIPKITPSELNWIREELEDILRGADEEPPVIDEELLERCLLSNDWFHSSGEKYVGNRWKVKWSEQATNLLAMKARGISDRRCAEHFGVAAGRVVAVKHHCLFRLRDLALLGRLTPLSDNGDIAAFAEINAQNNAPILRTLSRSGDRIEWRKDITSDEILMALGYNANGTISKTWYGVSERHDIYRTPVYAEAFKEWKRRLVEHFPPPKPTSERLDELETKLDGVLAALGQISESLQQEDNKVIDSQEQNRQQKELDMFLANRDSQVKAQERRARKVGQEALG